MSQLFFFFSLSEWIILCGVFVLFVIQLAYCFGVNGRVAFCALQKQPATNEQQPVSIVLSARNEYETLQRTLPKILTQAYPVYEVVVVNDCSEDESETLLASLQANYPQLVYRNIVKDEVFSHSKKMALGVGIKAARYDLCLLIDADCYPASEHWLGGMQQLFTPKTNVVLGYTRLEPKESARWVRADRFMQALHYLGKSLMRKPYMGVGSNLAFRKQVFFDNKGFDMRVSKHLREDRLFINQVATGDNTAVALNAEVATVSTLKVTPSLWLLQRCEELRTFALHQKGPRYPALFETLIRLCYYAAMVTAVFVFIAHSEVLFGLLAVEIVREALLSVVFLKALRRLGEKGLWFPLLCWHFIYPFVHLALLFASKFPPKKRK